MGAMSKRFILLLVGFAATAVMAAVLFLTAGHWDLPFFWAYIIVYGLVAGGGFLTVDPELIRERFRSGLRDPSPLVFMAKLAMWSHLIIAGLDAGRYHWSDTVSTFLQILGLAGFAAGCGVVVWAMAVNRFFIPKVRIQTERGHHLITSGPYRYVRHPGYAGIIISVFSSGLALGSWLAALPMVCLAGGVLYRVVVEDQFLRRNLDGYGEYMGHARFRLLPGVW